MPFKKRTHAEEHPEGASRRTHRVALSDPAPAAAAGAALWSPLLERSSAVPLSRQLATALRRAVSEGRFGPGARLPSTRALASELGIARSTVVGVYEQLAAEGYVSGRAGSGYFVPAPLAGRATPAPQTAPAITPRRLGRHGAALRDAVLPTRTEPRPFELGFAEVDGRFIATWKRLAAHALSGRAHVTWSYGDPQGEPALRQAVAEYLAAARGVRCRPEQIVITSGTQQGLSLIARILIDPGDPVWVEDPCYRSAVDIFRAAEARLVPVPVGAEGLDVAAMHGSNEPSPRLVYTTPSRQYPLGMAMPLHRRAALLAWAEAAGAWIVEDDYESEFQRPAAMLPSLQGLDRAGRVIYLGTFSKLMFPSLRLGYAVLPEDLVTPFTASRHLADRQSSALSQTMVTDFILGGHFARHLKRMRALYAERQAFLIDQIGRHLGGLLTINPAECGMYLTAWLPPQWSDRATAAALATAGIVTLPLSSFTLATPRRPGLVLGYTGHSETAMARAVEHMAAVFERQSGLIDHQELDLCPDQSSP